MNKTMSIIKIVLLGIISLTLIFILVLLLNKDMKFSGITLYEKTELVYEKDFTQEIDNLKINTTNNDVRIEENDTSTINVKVYDRKGIKPEAYVEKSTLIINNKKESKIGIFTGINGSSKIIISVPKNKLYNLNVKGVSTDTDSLVDLKDVKISTKSGDTVLKNNENVSINAISGDIDVEKINKLISIKTTSGDTNIGEVNGKITLEATSGDVTIDKVNLLENSYIRVVSGDITIGKTNEIYLDTKAVVSGDIKINKNYRKADIELKMKTTSGDVRINN